MQVTCVIFNFIVAKLKKTGEIHFNNFLLAPLFQQVINIKITHEIFHIFSMLSLPKLVCRMYSQHISVQICHIKSAFIATGGYWLLY